MAKGGVVSTYLNPNTAKDDLEFELLLCLAKILGVIERLEPTGVCETTTPAASPPPLPTSTTPTANLPLPPPSCPPATIDALWAGWATADGASQRAAGVRGT